MKNKALHIIAIILMLTAAACTNNKSAETTSESKTAFAPLKDRNPQLAKLADWPTVQQKVTELFSKIETDPKDLKSKLMLAQVYMQEARVTGEHPYYYPATLTILDDIIKYDPSSFGALTFKASVLLSLHHFKEALEVGTKAMNINPANGFIYGVLCDANVEMGNYEEALKMSNKMQSLRPGLESYSRASYLREIYGDNSGSIEAMKLAFQAGLPGSEEASWSGNTLAHLYEITGDLNKAEEITRIVLQQRPSYAFSIDALGNIELLKGNYDKAIAYFDSAIAIIPEVSFYENKAKALKKKGEIGKARETYAKVITMLQEDAESGHYVDMDLALVYLESGDKQSAMKYAKIEYARRPENIDVNSTMAWVHYNMGNYSEAKNHIDKAMRMGTQNAELLARAGMIELAAGNKKASEDLMGKAKKINSRVAISSPPEV